jgi:hypothetical protein
MTTLNMKAPVLMACTALLVGCSAEDTAQRAGEMGDAAIAQMEEQYGSADDLLPEAPNTDVYLKFSGYSDREFDKVYRYQANVTDRDSFIFMTFDNNDMDEQHIAVTITVRGINSEGEYTLDRQRNGDIYIEMDGIAFRTDAGNAVVNLTSTTGDYLEGSFTAQNVGRNQNRGDEVINIEEARFKLPLNDMRSR